MLADLHINCRKGLQNPFTPLDMKTGQLLIRDAPARFDVRRLVSLALTASLGGFSLHAYERLQGPTELLFCNKEKAFNGYTLFGVGNRTFLLDLEGRVVHTWPIGTNPHLLDNGNIVDASKDDPSGFQGFKEVDWDGKTVWEYTEKRENYAPHHDWVRIFNKKLNAPTTLYIANKTISYDQAVAAGADPKKASTEGGQMDAVVEVDMQGNVVWEWWFFDHVVQDVDPSKPNHVGAGKTIADHPGRININMPGRPLRSATGCTAIRWITTPSPATSSSTPCRANST